MARQKNLRVAYFAGSMMIGHDGVTRVIYKWVEHLGKHNIDSIFFTAMLPARSGRPARMHKVPSIVFPLNTDYRLPMPGMIYFEKKLDKFKPDIIHVNSPCPLGHAAIRYGRARNIPVVATYHTHFPSYTKYYNIKMLEPISWLYLRTFYNDCDETYVPSGPIIAELKKHGLKKLKLMPHGVDTKAFSPKHKSSSWKKVHGIEGKTALLFAGRLVWEKDLAVLAKIYARLRHRKDIAFVIAGDGPAREELQKLMPQALFLGKLAGKELSQAYASSDIFIFPSTTETFGNVIIEAMASGVLCICSSKGGARGSIINGKNGFVAKSISDYVRKIEYLIKDPKRRAGMAMDALTFARSQDWDKVCARLFSSYREVVQRKKPKTKKR